MPSQTFLNLDKEKQNKLIDAAMKEFAKVPYPEVSINQIIANAKISRGSFYMYFKDKEDLFAYLIEMNQQKLNQLTKKIFHQNKGDLRNSFITLYDEILNHVCKGEYIGILKNIFVFFHLHKKNFSQPVHLLFETAKTEIDTTNIKKSDLEFIFNILTQTLFISIVDTIKNNNSFDLKVQYLKKIDIICYGIYKEGKK